MSTHGGELEYVLIGQMLRLSFETERISDAVAVDACCVTTLLGAVDGRGDVDTQIPNPPPRRLSSSPPPRRDCRTPRSP